MSILCSCGKECENTYINVCCRCADGRGTDLHTILYVDGVGSVDLRDYGFGKGVRELYYCNLCRNHVSHEIIVSLVVPYVQAITTLRKVYEELEGFIPPSARPLKRDEFWKVVKEKPHDPDCVWHTNPRIICKDWLEQATHHKPMTDYKICDVCRRDKQAMSVLDAFEKVLTTREARIK